MKNSAIGKIGEFCGKGRSIVRTNQTTASKKTRGERAQKKGRNFAAFAKKDGVIPQIFACEIFVPKFPLPCRVKDFSNFRVAGRFAGGESPFLKKRQL